MRELELRQEHVVLPKGTRVVLTADAVARSGWVCSAGSLARVDEVDHPSYVVSTPSGHTLDVRRGQLSVQNQRVEQHLARQEHSWERLQHSVVLEVVVGSTAWNLAGPDSDLDVRGAFLLPWAEQVGLYKAPEELQPVGAEAQYWEVEKLIRNALRAEANALEALWTPIVRKADAVGLRLRERREIFASRRVLGSFGRYAFSQFERMRVRMEHQRVEEAVVEVVSSRPDLDDQALIAALSEGGLGAPDEVAALLRRVTHAFFDRGLLPSREVGELRAFLATGAHTPAPYRPKNAYNLLRLLHSGLRWLQHGEPLIEIEAGRPDGLRERLLSIKAGEAPLEGVIAEARGLADQLEAAVHSSPLPEEPDLDAADALLRELRAVAARRQFVLPGRRAVARRWWSIPEARYPLPQAVIDRFLDARGELDVVVCAVTGAHQYGFVSPDSDVDLKAIHLAPPREVLGMQRGRASFDQVEVVDGVELDWTSNEAAPALTLLQAGNGNMLERIFSPYLLRPRGDRAIERLDELRHLAIGSLNKGSAAHYQGFLRQCLGSVQRAPTVKGWLYAFRVALTGERLLRRGEVIADLPLLLEDAPELAVVGELIARKRAGAEHASVAGLEPALRAQVEALLAGLAARLSAAEADSALPDRCPNSEALDAWLQWWRTERCEPR